MFGKANNAEDSKLSAAIDRILTEMEQHNPEDPEYPALINHLERLTAMRAASATKRVSPDQMMLVAGNLLGILVIVAYEQKHVMVSKATSFVWKTR